MTRIRYSIRRTDRVLLKKWHIFVINSNLSRQVKIAALFSRLAEVHEQRSVFVEDLDIIESRVDHIKPAFMISGYAPGPGKETRFFAYLSGDPPDVAVPVQFEDLEPAGI